MVVFGLEWVGFVFDVVGVVMWCVVVGYVYLSRVDVEFVVVYVLFGESCDGGWEFGFF